MELDRLRTTEGIDVAERRVLVRVDLDVAIADGVVGDAQRMACALPGLKDLITRGARVIVLSHRGRPAGAPDAALSLRLVAEKLGELVGRPVRFVDATIGDEAQAASRALQAGEIAMLENLRFHPGEEADDAVFAAELARCGDLYVCDAFSCAHRAHASVHAITRLLPSFAGPSMNKEILALRVAVEEPRRPTVAIIGGAKVSTRTEVLTNLAGKVDKLIVGGGMANTFLAADGFEVGHSFHEREMIGKVRQIAQHARDKGCQIVLPVDVVVAEAARPDTACRTVPVAAISDGMSILDIGAQSIARFREVMAGSRTVLWSGPLGACEVAPFGAGTLALADAAGGMTRSGKLVSVAGGCETVAALNAAGVADKFTFVSSAGGAFLEWLEGRALPGVRALVEAGELSRVA